MNDYDYQKLRGWKRKLHLVKLGGGKCKNCGYNSNITALEFHHINPDSKEFQLDMRHLANRSMAAILNEFNKCEILCANCHREHHHPESDIILLEEKIKQIDLESAIKISKLKGKPKCVDCNVEINYTSTRCSKCEYINRRSSNYPKNFRILAMEKEKYGTAWCAKKYKVHQKTIRRWLQKNNLNNTTNNG